MKVSVAIITWNRKEKVLRAIESIYAQPYRPVEVVVADSASTDGTLEAVEARFPEVKIIKLHENLGCPGGRNIALANCSGDIVVSLDDDGWLSEETVEGCVQRFIDDPFLGVIGFNIIPPEGEKSCGQDRESSSFSGGAMAIRSNVLKEAGYYPSDFFRQAEETDLALKVIEAGYKIKKCPSLTMFHEVSRISTDVKKYLFYSCRNELSIVIRRYPLSLLPFAFLYKTLAWNIVGIKSGALRYTLLGTLAGVWQIPFCLVRRGPVTYSTIRKIISFPRREKSI